MAFGPVPLSLFALTLAGGVALAQPQAPIRMIATPLGVARTGVVKTIEVSDGAHVAAGQALVTLDCAPLEREINVRAANLEAAEAVYGRVVNGPRPEEIAIGEASVGVSRACAWGRRNAVSRSPERAERAASRPR